MSNILATAKQTVTRHFVSVIPHDPEDPIPTLHWTPHFSLFCDGSGHVRQIWSLTDRNAVVALCQATNVRFIDQSRNPRVRL